MQYFSYSYTMKTFVTLLIILLTISCNSPFTTEEEPPIIPPTPETPQLQVSPAELTFTHNTDQQTIEVQSNSSWTIDSKETWYKAQKNENSIEITVEPNPESTTRSDEIIVMSETLKRVITITQLPLDALAITPTIANIANYGSTLKVNIRTNVEYTVLIPNNILWIRENTTKTETTNKHSFEIDQNPTYTDRSAQIIFKDKKSFLADTLTVTQSPADMLSITPKTANPTCDATTQEVNVRTNIEYSILIPTNASWVKENTTKTKPSDKHIFEIAQNPLGTNRSTQIIFKDKKSTLADTITITQSAADISSPWTKVSVIRPGELAAQIKELQPEKIIHLVISGPLNDKDFQTIQSVIPRLEILDLKNAQFSTIMSLANKPVMQTVMLPESTTAIGDYTFQNCTEFKEVNIPSNLQTIGRSAFQDCKSLPNIELHNQIQTIGEYAFSGCDNITKIQLPNDLKKIEPHTFRNCLSLSKINIPLEVESIGTSAFTGCTNLQIVNTKNATKLTSINESAFQGCTALKTIEIPDNVVTLDTKSFQNCDKLQTVNLTNNSQLKTIGNSAFYGCSSLLKIKLPQTVEKIDARAFYNCTSLQEINFPEKVKALGSFAFTGCKALKMIICQAAIPPTITTSCGITPNKSITVKVPAGSESKYQNHTYWKKFTITN